MHHLEYTTKIEIKHFQEKKLKIALQYLHENSPFYQRLFQKNKIDILKIKTLENLQQIPFTEKKDLQQYNAEFICVPKEKIIDYITTSGTLSDPVTFAMTEADLERLAYNEQISFECAGAKKGDIFQLMTTLDKRFMAGLAYFLGIRKLGASIIRVGNGAAELQWDTIQRIKPNIAVVVPSFILKLIKYAEEHGIDYQNSSIKKFVCIGENLREQDFSLNLLGQSIKDKWNVGLYSTYASTEMATSFTECEYGCGGHHHPELIICELIDENGKVVPEGEMGELTVTTLGVEGMPLLRFKTGDLARFHYEPCKCGRTTMRISPIVGRLNQMIKYKGTTLYPPAIFDVLDNTPYVENYVVEVDIDENGNDNILIRIAICDMRHETDESQISNPKSQIEKDLKDRFRARIRVAPEIEICSANHIKNVTTSEMNRKPVKIIDKRRKLFPLYVFAFLLFFTSCIRKQEVPVPKPVGYFRLSTPEVAYQHWDSVLPFTFDYSKHASLSFQKKENNIYWLDILYPTFSAVFKMTCFPVQSNLHNFMWEEEEQVMYHVERRMTDDIQYSFVNDPRERVFGRLYELEGKHVATPFKFWLTDSSHYFVKGALYFSLAPNNDSLASIIDYLKKDALYMVGSWQWKE